MNDEDRGGAKVVSLDGFALDTLETITPQPPPTSERIKALLGRGLVSPETLTPREVRELSASVVYHLLSHK